MRCPSLAQGDKMTVKELEGYQVVCLFEAGNPSPALWGNLKAYVEGGGGLIIVPAGEEIDTPEGRKRFNDEVAARKLLPATLEKLETVPADAVGVNWLGEFDGNHPLLLPFREWSRSSDPDFANPVRRPFVNRYWKVKPLEKEGAIASYADRDKSPALVEKTLERGRVVLFTVVLDDRRFGKDRRWHNYWNESSFGLVLVNQVARYLAGDVSAEEVNFLCGQLVSVPLPADTPPRAVFRLDGSDPDLTDSERARSRFPGRRAKCPA